MDCKKIVDIVAEDISDYVATIWTGANYYIDCFSKKAVYAQIESAYENGISLSVEDIIRSRSVTTMQLMCKSEDFTLELLNDQVQWLRGRQTDVQVADNGVRAVRWSGGENE